MADEAEKLRKLYAKRQEVETVVRVAEASAACDERSATLRAEKLVSELNFLDLRITRLEAANGTSE